MGDADDRLAIIEVVGRYALAADSRDWSLLDQTFTPDATGDFGQFQHTDRDGVRKMMRDHLDGCGPTQHLLGNYRIEVSGNRAVCTCLIRAFHAGRAERAQITYELFGEYADRLIRTPAGWRIEHRTMRIFHETGDASILGPG
jgi:hypothetical protein